MARPHKLNADYFSHDANMRNNIKVKALRNKFGLTGYALWCMLLESLTEAELFQINADTLSIELLSADFGVESERLSNVIEYCVKLGLLSKVEGEVITCPSLYERLESVLRRKVFELLQQKPELLQQKLDKNEVIAELLQQKPKLLQQKPAKTIVNDELLQKKPQFPSLSFNLSTDSVKEESEERKEKEKKEKFVPPTLDEIREAMAEKGYTNFTAEEFFGYYDSQGWKKANGLPIVRWKGCLATFAHSQYNGKQQNLTTIPFDPGHFDGEGDEHAYDDEEKNWK